MLLYAPYVKGADSNPSTIWFFRCAPCHGPAGLGDGPAAHLYVNPPRNLAAGRLIYGETSEGLVRTISQGLPTGMPAFGGALSASQIQALADFILMLRADPPKPEVVDSLPAHSQTSSQHVAEEINRACIDCHPVQAKAWSKSRHAKAMGPGVVGQYPLLKDADVRRCNACHVPARPDSRSLGNGVDCVSCHIGARGLMLPKRAAHPPIEHGPSNSIESPQLQRSDSCLGCHNLPLSTAVEGRPLLDTWREWAASRWLPEGRQCQDCHMPNGDHGFYGAHLKERVQSAVKVSAGSAVSRAGRLSWSFAVENIGAGHHFPTTATPRAVVQVHQLSKGRAIEATESLWSIGRAVEFVDGRWVQHFDTRIESGGRLEGVYAKQRRAGADTVRLDLIFYPDWHYVDLYKSLLKRALGPVSRRHLETALQEAQSSGFLITRIDHHLEVSPNH